MDKKIEETKNVVKKDAENPLSHDEAMHLRNVVRGGLMRKVTPDEVADKLLDTGHIRIAVGGYMPTKEGHMFDAAYDQLHAKAPKS